ncbi:hypothetical protein P280DRAFT_462208 [Massarina eburnea CBS 473.64]|uniref:Pre-rrna processing protein n=1 Tax=Massarina eburnea CBS 473.64 TaxID=1395130 RepID=A0A6A6RII8_9PLEO|nr:hypothetical protein P280DRAFT_462208 [Massarina eburnea CBS 473.64]
MEDAPNSTWASTRTSSRPASHKSARSSKSAKSGRSQLSSRTTEETPLLAGDPSDDEEEDEPASATASLLRLRLRHGVPDTAKGGKARFWRKRWPSILALVVLCIAVVFIMLGFLATEGIEEYAMQAADFKPTKLSLDSLTANGIKIQVEGDFTMDASKVEKQSVRNLGRFGTWIASEVETGPTDVDVYLPEYGNVLVGKARIPGVKVSIRNGHTTHISLFAHVEPGSFEKIRNVANDWMDGRLGQIRLRGKAEVPIKSGLIHLGRQIVEDSLVFQGHDLPQFPRYNITRLNLREANDGHKGMGADVSIMVMNNFPVQLNVPPVAVDVLVDGCAQSELINVGTAETAMLEVRPNTDLEVNVTGKVEKLPHSLLDVCPDSAKSPLDVLLGDYMQGQDAPIYINCCKFPDPETPNWARDLLKDITVKVPFAGRDMGNLIKGFTMADVHFNLPDPFAEEGDPNSMPQISAIVKVDINLPHEMNFPLNVSRVKADADIYYEGRILGKLDLEKWQHANSTRVDAHGNEAPSLLVESEIKNAPIDIVDQDVFSEVVQALLFGTSSIMMDVKAAVSVKVDTPMGELAVRDIPAEGVVPVKPIGSHKGGHNVSTFAPKIYNLSIVDTSRTSIVLQAHANLTNPTNYSATVPYFNINVLVNETILGQAIAKNVEVHPGNNSGILITVVWDPYRNSGAIGALVGRELLSQFISGYNTSLTLQAHNGTIPSQPALGSALSRFPITLPAPSLSTPKKPDDSDPDDPDDGTGHKRTHFIRDATMHLISSTALFTLASPFNSTTLYITNLNATAYHDGHPSGKILYDLPFAVPPGLTETPRLPVDWSFGSIGYDAILNALGGTLKLSAFAHVGIRIGRWREQVWYQGASIGAHVRL